MEIQINIQMNIVIMSVYSVLVNTNMNPASMPSRTPTSYPKYLNQRNNLRNLISRYGYGYNNQPKPSHTHYVYPGQYKKWRPIMGGDGHAYSWVLKSVVIKKRSFWLYISYFFLFHTENYLLMQYMEIELHTNFK